MKNFVVLMLFAISMAFPANGQDSTNDYFVNANNCFVKGDYHCAVDNYIAYQKTAGIDAIDVKQQIENSEKCKTSKFKADNLYDIKNYKDASILYSDIYRLNPNDSYAKSRYDYCLRMVNINTGGTKKAKRWNPFDKIEGHDVSFGITVGMVNGDFDTSAAGDYLGSIINYGYGDDSEKPSYSPEVGFSAGLLLDIRLEKNLYLQTGLNYVNVRVKNSFENSFDVKYFNSGTTFNVDPSTTTTYVKGTAHDDFTEKYEMHYIELPLLLSFRFRLSQKSNLQFYLGPYIGYGFLGECKVSGTTDWPQLKEYNKSNDSPTGETYFMNRSYRGSLDLFEKDGNTTTLYTTGNMAEHEYDYEFKDSPFKKINAGITAGAALEFSGFNIGVFHDWGLTNIANDDYWLSKRMDITQVDGGVRMKDYKHKLNKLQVKVGYIFRW